MSDPQHSEGSGIVESVDTTTETTPKAIDTNASREKVRVVVKYTGKRTKIYYKDSVDSTARTP
jgi:hypothetical protein